MPVRKPQVAQRVAGVANRRSQAVQIRPWPQYWQTSHRLACDGRRTILGRSKSCIDDDFSAACGLSVLAETESSAPRPVDALALRLLRRRLHRAATVPWLHAEVARRMAERLPIVRMQPQTVLAWGLRVGGGGAEIRQAYPKAAVAAVEAEAGAGPALRPWWRLGRADPAPLLPAAVQPASGDLLWCNMGLHFEADPRALLRRWQQALRVDGFLMFSTLGPGTLQPLRAAYQARGWPPPHAPFVDMHDLGDMLLEAGFADPVMDQETVVLTWPDAAAAVAELRTLGGNAALGRHAGLRTPRWRQQLFDALSGLPGPGAPGRVALPFEIVYGHAFKAAPRVALGAESSVSLEDMRTMVRQGLRRP